MSSKELPDDFNDAERATLERVHRAAAIANTHAKLMEATSLDASLRGNPAQGSRRFVQHPVRIYDGTARQHARIALKPRRDGDQTIKGVELITLDFAAQSLDRADQHAKDVYMMRVSAQQITTEALFKMYAPNPVLVPSQTIVGEAVKTDGSILRFVLSPEELSAYRYSEDVHAVTGEQANGGQECTVFQTAEMSMLQSEMTSEWFTAEQLSVYIGHGDPVYPEDPANSGSVAS